MRMMILSFSSTTGNIMILHGARLFLWQIIKWCWESFGLRREELSFMKTRILRLLLNGKWHRLQLLPQLLHIVPPDLANKKTKEIPKAVEEPKTDGLKSQDQWKRSDEKAKPADSVEDESLDMGSDDQVSPDYFRCVKWVSYDDRYMWYYCPSPWPARNWSPNSYIVDFYLLRVSWAQAQDDSRWVDWGNLLWDLSITSCLQEERSTSTHALWRKQFMVTQFELLNLVDSFPLQNSRTSFFN